LICLARSAYLRVFKVSSKLLSAGLTQAIIIVLLLPPRESVKNNERICDNLHLIGVVKA